MKRIADAGCPQIALYVDRAEAGLGFLVLTATRSAAARQATWDEMELDTLVWTVPATRTKAGRQHRVPLCRRAVEILDEARRRVVKFGQATPRGEHRQAEANGNSKGGEVDGQ